MVLTINGGNEFMVILFVRKNVCDKMNSTYAEKKRKAKLK